MSLRKMLSAADGNEPPPEYIGRRQRKEPSIDNHTVAVPEHVPSRPPVSRLSRAAAEAAAHVDDLEQQVGALSAAASKDQGRIQFLEMRVSQLETEKTSLELRLENSEIAYRELRGRLDAAAGLMIDILQKHRQPSEGAAVAATLGEQAVAEELATPEQRE